MSGPSPTRFTGPKAIAQAVDWILAEFGADLRIATPLGLGKPNRLLNALYARVAADPARKLVLFTALSLSPPDPKGDLARRFFGPFRDRQWGKDYPILRYAVEAEKDALPPNIRVHEFYFQAGAALRSDRLQRDYLAANYTHVAEAVESLGVTAILQLVARRTGPDGRERFSLSCNPDLTLDVAENYRKLGRKIKILAMIHPDLPFLGGDAEVRADFFSGVVDAAEPAPALFSLPRTAIDAIDHRIGFFASRLVEDGGTLQVGIGSLSDAVVDALILRQRENGLYAEIARDFDASGRGEGGGAGGSFREETFRDGLYGLSEMVTDGFMHLRKAGILKREVHDESSGERTFLHGAFFLGSNEFYAWLRALSPEEASGIRMTRVSKVNDLYDPNEILLRKQRKRPRFLNTCMQATLLGGAASETLPDGRVVSGVGGQYNFVAMAHELPDSRSVLMLRSTREDHGHRTSNIVWSHPMLTIPRHLRDIVVTEYGVADLRNQTDENCIRRMIAIADSEFQPELVAIAKRNGKLDPEYEVPKSARENTPARVHESVEGWRKRGVFKEYPFGSDFTETELKLIAALEGLGRLSEGRFGKFKVFARAITRGGGGRPAFTAELTRMGLARPYRVADWISARALVAALRS